MLEISGVLVPLVTPFTDDMSAVSEVRLARLVRRLRERNCQGFVVGTDTGEFATLSQGERKMVVETVIRESSNSVPLIVHATHASTMAALDLAQHAQRHGARAALVMPPVYGRFTIEEVQQHYKTIANYANFPIIACDLPDQDLSEVFEELKHHRGIAQVQHLSTKWCNAACISPYVTTDEFAIQDLVASPLGMILDSALIGDPGDMALETARAIRTHGAVRVIKSLLQYNDFDMGPPRTPLQPLTHEQLKEIAA